MSKVSIIVPVYNVQSYLNACIESIINQTMEEIEIILVNDGSTDDSLQICIDYSNKDKRIKLINKENGGLSSARNAGLDIATGEYVGFVDSDDWIELDMFELMYKEIKEKNCDLVVCNYFSCNQNVDIKSWFSMPTRIYSEDIYLLIEGFLSINKNYIPQFAWNKLYDKKIIDEQKIRFKDKLKPGEDYLFTLTYLLNSSSVSCLSESFFYHYRLNPKSITNSYIDNIWENQQLLYSDILEILKVKSKYNLEEIAKHQLVIRAITSIRNEASAKNLNKKKDNLLTIKEILNNPILNKYIENRNYRSYPLRDRIYIFLIYHKMINLTYLTSRVEREIVSFIKSVYG